MCMNNYALTFANTAENGCFTLMRSIPASILSCSTSFLAWAILLVVDILIHENTPTQEKTEGVKKQNELCLVYFTRFVREQETLISCILNRDVNLSTR